MLESQAQPAPLPHRTLAHRVAVPLFAFWTLFVWGGRFRNLAADPGGLSEASRWSLAGAVIFPLLALAVLCLLVVGSGPRIGLTRNPVRPLMPPARALVIVLAGLTAAVWLVRAAAIAVADHSVGFVVVHLVLAAVSIGLAVLALVSVRAGYPRNDG